MIRRFLTLGLLSLLPARLWAGETEAYKAGEYRSGDQTLRYRYLEPARVEPGTKYPLVLFLHGAGERGDDNKKQLVHGGSLFANPQTRARYPAFVIFPQCPAGKQWVEAPWSGKEPHRQPDEPSEPMRLTRELLDRFLKDHPIDPARIYVMGLSMGGFGTWDFAARYPNRTAAIVPICGGADDRTAVALKDIPTWAFHGALDTAVWPERSRSMVAALKQAGNPDVRYTEYEKVGHNSWDRAFREPDLLPWLFAQKKRP